MKMEKIKVIWNDIIMHTLRVTMKAYKLCKDEGINKKDIRKVVIAALLHDTGKFKIPFEILFKQGTLLDDERAIINQHVSYSVEIARAIGIKDLTILNLIKAHHSDIVNGNRLLEILQWADMFDAIHHERAYKAKVPERETYKILSGKFTNSTFSVKISKAS